MVSEDKKDVWMGDDDVDLNCDPRLECIDSCKWILPNEQTCE